MPRDYQSSFKTPEHSDVVWRMLPGVASTCWAYVRDLDGGPSPTFLFSDNRCRYIDRYKGSKKIFKLSILLSVGGTTSHGGFVADDDRAVSDSSVFSEIHYRDAEWFASIFIPRLGIAWVRYRREVIRPSREREPCCPIPGRLPK